MNRTPNPYDPTGILDLGSQLYQLRSTSEALQGVMLIGAVGVGFLASFAGFGNVPLPFFIVVGVAFAAAVVWVARFSKRLGTCMTVFDSGMEVVANGKTHRFAFDDVEQFSIHHTHHRSQVAGNNVYMGTRAKFEIVLEGRFSVLGFDVEYHREKATATMVSDAGKRLCEAVELRLSKKLETEGFIALTPSVSLTLDGLNITTPSSTTGRRVPLEQIASWHQSDDKMHLTRRDEAMPFLSLPISSPNFVPAFSLMARMCEAFASATANEEEASAIV